MLSLLAKDEILSQKAFNKKLLQGHFPPVPIMVEWFRIINILYTSFVCLSIAR